MHVINIDYNVDCRKKYCANCLRRHYGGEDMLQVLTKHANWNCPFKMGACCCSKCRNDTSKYKGGQMSQEEFLLSNKAESSQDARRPEE